LASKSHEQAICVAATVTIRLMNHLRASALTVEEFDRKENARTGQEITMPEQWRLYNR
jgi:hypothetical protein